MTFLKRVILKINYRPLTHVYVSPFDFNRLRLITSYDRDSKKSTVLRTIYVRDKLTVQGPSLTFSGKTGSTTVLKTMPYYGYAKVKPPKVRDLVIMVDKTTPETLAPRPNLRNVPWPKWASRS